MPWPLFRNTMQSKPARWPLEMEHAATRGGVLHARIWRSKRIHGSWSASTIYTLTTSNSFSKSPSWSTHPRIHSTKARSFKWTSTFLMPIQRHHCRFTLCSRSSIWISNRKQWCPDIWGLARSTTCRTGSQASRYSKLYAWSYSYSQILTANKTSSPKMNWTPFCTRHTKKIQRNTSWWFIVNIEKAFGINLKQNTGENAFLLRI